MARKRATGQEAIDLLNSGVQIDLILSDLIMPGVDGLTLLLHVKQHYPGIPFAFMAADGLMGKSSNAGWC
jgi:CheY-like chemotaxis protein